MNYFLGIDVGSVSTDLVIIDEYDNVIKELYLKTSGRPIDAVKEGMACIRDELGKLPIGGVGTTGSGRQLADVIVGADVVKNEITSHSVAALKYYPDVRTIFEIGGQDSKIIILRDGVVVDFAMNTVCAAGTGSFLDRQASRLNIPIEEFGDRALKSTAPVRIAGRCAVFAESDMIHKQQLGYREDDIINGLCDALVRNYLNNVGKGKQILSPIVFQGGVAANKGMKRAFERELGQQLFVPERYGVMGAIGAAILAKSCAARKGSTNFYGFDMVNFEYKTKSFECGGCPNMCEVVEIYINGDVRARWGSRCGKWNIVMEKAANV